MDDHEPLGSAGPRSDGDGTHLPVPAGNRLPAARPTAALPVERAGALIRAMAGAPLVAAAVAGATAAAAVSGAVSGAAAMSRLAWPGSWVRRRPASEDAPPSEATWPGPGVHVSYTHVEIHWSTRR
jgi:hypothetical protein